MGCHNLLELLLFGIAAGGFGVPGWLHRLGGCVGVEEL